MDLANSISKETTTFVQKIGSELSEEQWDKVKESIIDCYEKTEPRELLNEAVEYQPKKKVTHKIMGSIMQFTDIDPLLEKYFVQCIAQVTLVNITSSVL